MANKSKAFSTAIIAVVIGLLASATAGCRPAPVAIQGTVTLDGEPLDQAAIQFIPTAPNRKKTGCAIQQGKYELPAKNGLLPGAYRADILDLPLLTHEPAPPRPELHRYSNDSPLKIVVEPGGTRTFDFELATKP
jgi:hypothetical protein